MATNNSFRKFLKRLPGVRPFVLCCRKLLYRWSGGACHAQQYYQADLIKGLGDFQRQSDISDHLNTLFALALEAQPRLIVELGTRGGESTRALLSASSLTGATMLSVDIEDCSGVNVPFRERWNFLKADDIVFGQREFAPWCAARGLKPEIDVLFIDTSHEYEHTRQEIAVWSPLLAERGVMIFHDTNMGGGVYARLDGSVGHGWDNQRGVIRAVEEFLGRSYDENDSFVDVAKNFLVVHHPYCNGLTVLKKIPEARI
jgi:predicted O-methyltransferase YrrM